MTCPIDETRYTLSSMELGTDGDGIKAKVFYRSNDDPDTYETYITYDLREVNEKIDILCRSRGSVNILDLFSLLVLRPENKADFDSKFKPETIAELSYTDAAPTSVMTNRIISINHGDKSPELMTYSFDELKEMARKLRIPEWQIEGFYSRGEKYALAEEIEIKEKKNGRRFVITITLITAALLALGTHTILTRKKTSAPNTNNKSKASIETSGDEINGTHGMTDQDAINAAIKKDKPLVTNTPKPQPTPTPTKFNKTVTEATKKPEATKKKVEPTPKPTFHPIPGILRSDTAKTKQDKIDFMDVVTDYTSNFIPFNYENMASKKDWWTIKVISDAFNDALEHPNKMSAFATSLGKFEKGAETVKFNGQWTEVSYDELDILIRIYPTRLAQALVTEGFVSSEYHAIIEQRAEEVDEYYTNVMEGYGK